jgi:hypothetical protein
MGGRLYKVGELLRPGLTPNKHFESTRKRPTLSKAPSSQVTTEERESSSFDRPVPTTLNELLEKENTQQEEVDLPDAAKGDEPTNMFE